jgi:hypothetical protein
MLSRNRTCQSRSSSSRLHFLSVVLLLHPFCLFLLVSLSTVSSPFIVFVPFFLREVVGRAAGSGVFNSFPLRKQSDKTKTQPHISFIVSSSYFPSTVYSEYKINTDGIEQSSL